MPLGAGRRVVGDALVVGPVISPIAQNATIGLSERSHSVALGCFPIPTLSLVHCPPSGHFAGFVNNFVRVPLACLDSREAA